jgi:glucan phosphoethanolaminetransferase (alkaline phosphatase superfamily)
MNLDRKQSKSLFVYFLLIILIIAISDIVFNYGERHYVEIVYRTLTCFSAFLVPVFIFRKRLKLYALLLSPVLLLVPLLLCSIIFYHLMVSEEMLMLMANTTKREVMGLVSHYTFPLTISFIICIGTVIFLIKKLPSSIPSKFSLVISIGSLLIFLLLPATQHDDRGSHITYLDKLKGNISATFPFSVIYSARVVNSSFELMRNSKKARDDFRFFAKQIPYNPKKQIYVLVIGETSRGDHWGINGYFRNTSPLISKRENLISFANVVSGACVTEYAVPQIITLANADNFDDHYKQKSIVSAFKEAGFTTYWITDQIDWGNIKLHEEESDHVYRLQLTTKEPITLDNTDIQLISYLKNALAEPGDRKFIVLHTTGSHWDYGQQYTSEFDFFKPSEKTIAAEPSDFSKKEFLINSYDNTILFTDWFLDSAIKVVSREKAFSSLFYISDHGEDLFDDSYHRFQHGDFEATIFSARVPFFIWYNDSVKISCAESIYWLLNHKYSKIGEEDVFHTMTDMFSIHFPLQDSTKCITRSSFVNSKQRILSIGNVVLSYDSLAKKESKAKMGM